MQTILDSASRLADQIQEVISFLELEQPAKALKSAKHSIVTLHLLSTALAVEAARLDSIAADVQRLTAQAVIKNRPHPKSEKLT